MKAAKGQGLYGGRGTSEIQLGKCRGTSTVGSAEMALELGNTILNVVLSNNKELRIQI